MKLSIKKNQKNESANVQNAQESNHEPLTVNPEPSVNREPEVEEAVIVSEEPKAKPKAKSNAKTAASAPHFYLVTYTTKHGGTGSYVMGFKTEQEAKALADNACKTVNSTWRYNDKGEKVYAISLGARYCDIAVRLCDALNKGDKASVSKAIAETHDVYANAVAAGKAERDAKRAELKAQEAKAKAKELAKVKKQNGLYSAEDVAAMLKTIEAGGDIPEDIKKVIAA